MKMNIHSVTLNQDSTTDASTLICCLREILGELLFFSLDFFLGMRFLSLLKRSIIGGAKHRIASSTWSSNYSRTYTLLFHGTEEVLVQKKPLYYYNFGPTALLIYEIKARRKEPKKSFSRLVLLVKTIYQTTHHFLHSFAQSSSSSTVCVTLGGTKGQLYHDQCGPPCSQLRCKSYRVVLERSQRNEAPPGGLASIGLMVALSQVICVG